MTKQTPKEPVSPKQRAKAEREARIAAALRANLRRRKQASRKTKS